MKPNLSLLTVILFVLWLPTNISAQQSLWYPAPAEKWVEALPIGNGRLGAMVFGKTNPERIQLNEDSLWPGNPDDWGHAEGKREDLEEIRALLRNGENRLADSLMVAKFSRKGILRSHQTMGDLWFDFGEGEISEYRRELDLSQALVKISYKKDGHQFTQEVFSSATAQAIIIKLKTEDPKGMSGKIWLNRPEDDGHPTVAVKAMGDNILLMDGEVTQRKGRIDSKPWPILEGVKFQVMLQAVAEGGKITSIDQSLEVNQVKEITLYLFANTSFYHQDYKAGNLNHSESIFSQSYESLLSEHIEDYQSLYDRVKFDLVTKDLSNIPTDQRLSAVKEGQLDLGLQKQLFDFGRYLLISSSRPGTLPANLQGIWNDKIQAPWNADYHLNINLQMNYWPAEVTGLSELHDPFFDFIDGLIQSGKKTAEATFGMRGAAIPHSTDLWQSTYLLAERAYWGSWLGAGAWLMSHYWERFAFTGDEEFLRNRYLPAAREIVVFYLDWLVPHPDDGLLVSSPSSSPENSFINEQGDSVALTKGAAMDQQLIAELFSHFVKACEILDVSDSLLDEVIEKQSNLRSGLQIGEDGRILEWDRSYPEPEKGHRHMSHLYALHPSNFITKGQTPELFEAARQSLLYRLDNGGAGTGWSRAWLINFSARLLDGEMASEHVQKLLAQSLYPNLFDAHPPFQIDGNFGYTAGVAEMLLQSHENGMIRLLPALPQIWETGEISGLKARGNYTISLKWQDGNLNQALIESHLGGQVTVVYRDMKWDLDLKKGEIHQIDLLF